MNREKEIAHAFEKELERMRSPKLQIKEDPEWNKSTQDVETLEADGNLAEGRLILIINNENSNKFSADTKTKDIVEVELNEHLEGDEKNENKD